MFIKVFGKCNLLYVEKCLLYIKLNEQFSSSFMTKCSATKHKNLICKWCRVIAGQLRY